MTSITALSSLALGLTAALSAQTPKTDRPGDPSPAAGPAVIAHAQAFPDSTLVCISIAPDRERIGGLTQTKAYAALALALKTRGIDLHDLGARLADRSGLSASQWLAALQGGVTIGLTAVNTEGQPAWLAVIDARDEVKSLAVALDKLRQADGITATTVDAGPVRAWNIVSLQGRAAYAIDDTRLVFGDSAATVGEAVTRLRAPNRDRTLAATNALMNLDLAASTESGRLMAILLRPSAIAERVIQALPATIATRARTAVRLGDLARMEGLGLTVRLNGEQLAETMYLDWPMPRNGLLAEFLAPRSALLAETAAAVPGNVDSFTLSSIDLKRLFSGTVRLLSDVAPQQARSVQSWLGQIDDTLGVKLNDDLIAKLGDQMATLHWNTPQGTETAVVVKLNDTLAFESGLRRALANAKTPISEQTHNGYRTIVLTTDGAQPALAVTEQSLVMASSSGALHRALDQAAAPRGAEHAVKVPSEATGYSRAKLRTMLATIDPAALDRSLALPVGTALPMRTAVEALRESVTDADQMTMVTTRDERFVTMETQSPLGGVWSMLTTLAATMALPQVAGRTVPDLVGATPAGGARQTLARIVEAQRELRASMPTAKYGSLQELLDAGLLNESECGRRTSDNLLERDGYLITVLLGRGKNDDGKSFIAVAWPAANRTGAVYAATNDHPHLVNELMARALGLAMVELDDIYSDGFGSPMRTGWRVEQPAVAQADPAGKKPEKDAPPAPRDGRLAAAIADLERGGAGREQALTVVRGALTGDQPELIALAAHTLGKLRIADDVPSLTALVSKHTDPQVRNQAMWALWRINDPRSKQAAIDALKSDDPALRALAASNLGQLKATDAVQPLLRLLPAEAAPVTDHRDRTAALLALAEIGDPSQLLKMAAAVSKGDDATIQALAYAIQTLSPKLAKKEEATTLVAMLDHARPMVRRYAIQRLGELKDATTARALESRLAAETRELQPLVQVALHAVRGDLTEPSPSLLDRAEGFADRAVAFWERLKPNQRYAAVGAGIAMFTLALLILALRRRQKLRAQGEAWAAMVAPSSPSAGNDVDEVDLNIGDSGVYSANDGQDDALLESMRPRSPLSRR